MKQTISNIAKTHLHIDILEPRKSDRLDFHDCAIWEIEKALEQSYIAGYNSAYEKCRYMQQSEIRI